MKFDGYTFQARILPAFILMLPIFIELNYTFVKLNYNIVISLPIINVVCLCFLILISNWVRYLGRKKEIYLFKKWGGAPTTRFLRYNNSEYNPVLKKQVINYLKMMFNKIKFPKEDFEEQCPQKADETYEAYVSNIRNLTRDTKKYKLLYVENKNYGMWRNLYSTKYIALVMLVFLFLLNIFLAIFVKSIFSLKEIIAINVIFLIGIIIWAFVITENRVKDVANCYAQRLFESLIILNENRGKNEHNDKKAD